jgi:hypothetical protein
MLMGWMYLDDNKELLKVKKFQLPDIKDHRYLTYDKIKKELSIEENLAENVGGEEMNKTRYNRNRFYQKSEK